MDAYDRWCRLYPRVLKQLSGEKDENAPPFKELAAQVALELTQMAVDQDISRLDREGR